MITLNAGPDNCYLFSSCVESGRFNLSSILFLKSIKMFRIYSMCNVFYGEVAEWFKALAWKACVR
jgi:hypothetical protein